MLTVAHAERQDASSSLVVLDRLHVLQGTRTRPVQFADVERLTRETSPPGFGWTPGRQSASPSGSATTA